MLQIESPLLSFSSLIENLWAFENAKCSLRWNIGKCYPRRPQPTSPKIFIDLQYFRKHFYNTNFHYFGLGLAPIILDSEGSLYMSLILLYSSCDVYLNGMAWLVWCGEWFVGDWIC